MAYCGVCGGVAGRNGSTVPLKAECIDDEVVLVVWWCGSWCERRKEEKGREGKKSVKAYGVTG